MPDKLEVNAEMMAAIDATWHELVRSGRGAGDVPPHFLNGWVAALYHYGLIELEPPAAEGLKGT